MNMNFDARRLPLLYLAMLLTAFALLGACGGGGGNPDPEAQVLEKQAIIAGGTAIELNLAGSRSGDFDPVTYFIFGSEENIGDEANIPLQSGRLAEQSFGPLAEDDELNDVDLTPWAAYPFIYLRAATVANNRAHLLRPGRIYEFWTN